MTTLALTPQPTTASVLLSITGTPLDLGQPLVEQRRNLVPNPSFEVNTTGWAANTGTPTLARITTSFYKGVASLRFTATAAGFMLATTPTGTSGMPVVAGQKYTVSAYVQAATTGRMSTVGIYWYTAAGAAISNSFSGSTDSVGSWTRRSYTLTAPATAAFAAVGVSFDNNIIGEQHYVDAVMLEKSGSLGSYFDGASTPASGYEAYAWTGTANQSASTYSTRLAADGPVTVTRTDANGTNPVRLRDGQKPISGSMTVVDNEAALTGTLRYDVLDSAGVTTTASTVLNGTTPVLHAVALPQYRSDLALVTGYNARRDSAATVHEVVGRADPVVVQSGVSRLRQGRLELWCATFEDALALQAVCSTGRFLMLRQPTFAGMDMYLHCNSSEVNPENTEAAIGWRWSVSCDYVEVKSPSSSLLGAAGWTYSDIPATYATYSAQRAAFASYAALAVGP